jgi:transposase InsO family protein
VSDGVPEYVGQNFKFWCRKSGIRTKVSAPYTPEENGKIERKWGTVVGMARCMIHDAGLSKEYWTYVLNHAFYVKNMCLHSAINTTPYERMYRTKPNVSFLKVFGCKAYAFLEKQFRKKFDCTAREGVFLGLVTSAKPILLELTKEMVRSR